MAGIGLKRKKKKRRYFLQTCYDLLLSWKGNQMPVISIKWQIYVRTRFFYYYYYYFCHSNAGNVHQQHLLLFICTFNHNTLDFFIYTARIQNCSHKTSKSFILAEYNVRIMYLLPQLTKKNKSKYFQSQIPLWGGVFFFFSWEKKKGGMSHCCDK